MKTSNNRREFLKNTLAGASFAGLAVAVHAPSLLAASSGAVSTSERHKLLDQAHFGRKTPASGKKGMVICSHPLASQAGVDLLKSGGNAADAALAMSVCQTVVEPHMTGITGVLSMLYFDAKTGQTTYVNGSAARPMADLPGFGAADIAAGRGVAVPGFWAGFEAAHAKHGRASRAAVMAAAIDYAREGFEIHPFLWGEIFTQFHMIALTQQGQEIFMKNNTLPRPGDLLVQKRAADTLEALLAEGNEYFYRGAFARELVDTVQAAGGVLTMDDMARYEARWQEPSEGTYRKYRVVASPPPDHGGSHMIEILNMVELLDLQKLGPPTDSPESLFHMARIAQQVYLDGSNQHDPASHVLPMEILLSKEYAQMRFELMQMDQTLDAGEAPPPPGSNHVTAVDAEGNVATILHSCMSYPWSNGLFAGGVTIVAAGAHFLRVMPGPGDRISAYVCPNIIFDGNRPVLASGSPSVSLLQNILQNTVNILDFGIPIGESVNRPRFGGGSYTKPGTLLVELDVDPKVRDAAANRGIRWDTVNPWNWHHGSFEGIHMTADGTARACGDPRRNAMAIAV
ncbi:MAG TPA: gamma-glutamyltransferase [Xanthomonadales bacterium]|nr:gamma-glutamyltransferase [Xanthomonadales bacterium]